MNKEAEILYKAFQKLSLRKLYHIADICYYLSMYVRGDINLLYCKGSIDIIFKSILDEEINKRKEYNHE